MNRAMRQQFSLFAKTSRFIGKALFEGYGLLEPASLHDAAPSLEGAGAQPAFSSPIKAKSRAATPQCRIPDIERLANYFSNL